MAFSIDELKQEYGRKAFFTSNRHCIEYLLEINLEPLAEYALLVYQNKAQIFSPYELSDIPVVWIKYQADSRKCYQNPVISILDLLDEYELPILIETAFEKMVYAEYFKMRACTVMDISMDVERLSRIKTPEQIKAVENCVDLTERAYKALMGKNVTKETELSLFYSVTRSIRETTQYPNEIIYDFIAGKKTGAVSGQPMNDELQIGDTLIADLLPRNKGVFADMTRTFFVGKAGKEQTYIYKVLQEVMEQTEELLKPGISAKEIYRCMYGVFAKYELNDFFPHHAGHGLGMGCFEAPYFLKEEETILEKDMIVTLEPGIYFEHKFGMRIENDYHITENKARRLGSLPLSLEDYILSFGG